MAARKAHNLEVPGSSPGPATKLAFHEIWKADWVKTAKIVTDFSLCPRAFFKIRGPQKLGAHPPKAESTDFWERGATTYSASLR